MRLFKVELRFKRKSRGRYGVDTVVHAQSPAAAEGLLAGKYIGCEIVRIIELASVPKHFVIADLVD